MVVPGEAGVGGGEAAHLKHVVGGLVTVPILQFRPHFKLADAAEVGTVEHHQRPTSVHAQVVALLAFQTAHMIPHPLLELGLNQPSGLSREGLLRAVERLDGHRDLAVERVV